MPGGDRPKSGPVDPYFASDKARRERDAAAAPQSVFQETTDVHNPDAQVFRAIKALGNELEANKLEAARAHGALKAEVVAVKRDVAEIKSELATNTRATSRVEGKIDVLMTDRRPAHQSSEQRAIAKEVLADQVLAEQRSRNEYSRKM